MNTNQINSLPAGRTMDNAVAAAINCEIWLPSTDMNQALIAAERSSLFRRWISPDDSPPEDDVAPGWEGIRFLTHCNQWCVSEWDGESFASYRVIARGNTAPLAICRAILNLHHREPFAPTNHPNSPQSQ